MERNEIKTGFRFVAFDLDGTICNTLSDIASSLNRALDALGFSTYSDDGVSGLIGRSIVWMCQHAVPEMPPQDKVPVLQY